MRRILLVLALAPFAFGATNSTKELEAATKELADVELAVGKFMLFLPAPEHASAEWEEFIAKTAHDAGLETPVAVKPIAGSEAMPPVELYRFDISGSGPALKVQRFLRLVALARLYRILDFETLLLSPAPKGSVHFRSRIVLAAWRRPAPAPFPADTLPPVQRMTAAVQQEVSRNRAWLATLTALDARYQPRRLLDSLSAFGREEYDKAVALTEIRYDGTLTLDGVLLGAVAKASLDPALRKAGLLVDHIERSRSGDCQAFAAVTRLKPGAISEESYPSLLLEEGTAETCKAAKVATTTAPAVVRHAGGDALTLHLRDIDVADVFRVLHDLTKESFVVDPEVRGRVNVDIEAAGVKEAFDALSSAGVAITPGPLHRVHRAATTIDIKQHKYDGQPMDIQLKDAGILDVLQMFAQVTGLNISVQPDVHGTVTAFSGGDVKWDYLFDTMIQSLGLTYKIEGLHVFIGTEQQLAAGHRGAIDVAEAAERQTKDALDSGRRPWEYVPPEKLSLADLQLVGLARAGAKWTGYAYALSRKPIALEAGQTLFDGEVRTVGAEGVTVQKRGAEAITVQLASSPSARPR